MSTEILVNPFHPLLDTHIFLYILHYGDNNITISYLHIESYYNIYRA